MAEIRYLHREDTQPIMNLTIGAGLLYECLTIGAGLLYECLTIGAGLLYEYAQYSTVCILSKLLLFVRVLTVLLFADDILIPHLNVIVLTYSYFKKMLNTI